MGSNNQNNTTQIIVALIGLIGVLGTALIANIDKFSHRDKELEESTTVEKYSLRRVPITVSIVEFKRTFNLNENMHPGVYINNNFKDMGDVVIDNSTGLMWQKKGSSHSLSYTESRKYAEKLNKEKFGGYLDWRLPTIPELISLLEPSKQPNGFYINSVFSHRQRACWSSDTVTGEVGAAWNVNFLVGVVRPPRSHNYYARVVRSTLVDK